MDKTITVTQRDQYGTVVYYPACAQAELFAALAGTKTLTKQALLTIQKLGYKVAVRTPRLAEFN